MGVPGQPADLVLDRGEVGFGGVQFGIEAGLTGVEPGDLLLLRHELLLRRGRALLGILASSGQAADFVIGGLGAGADRVDLSVQAREALTTVGRCTSQPGHPALLVGVCRFGFGPGDGRRLASGQRLPHGCLEFHPRRLDSLSLGFELSGVAPNPTLVGFDGCLSHPLRCEPSGATHTLTQAGKCVPSLLGGSQPRRIAAQGLFEFGLRLTRFSDGLLHLGTTLLERRLVGEFGGDGTACGHDVVRQQTGPRIAGVGLDDRRLACDLSLTAQRLQLASEFGEDVLKPGEVAVGRLQLAKRLLLALAVLENARGLLDEPAAILRRGSQHCVELTLANDDVHLAADAGVAEQFLNVEESARRAIDGVLGTAVAEHRPRDGDLGVVDRQSAV